MCVEWVADISENCLLELPAIRDDGESGEAEVEVLAESARDNFCHAAANSLAARMFAVRRFFSFASARKSHSV